MLMEKTFTTHTKLSSLIEEFYGYEPDEKAMEFYSNNFKYKNEQIQELFKDSEDGRLILSTNDGLSKAETLKATREAYTLINEVENMVKKFEKQVKEILQGNEEEEKTSYNKFAEDLGRKVNTFLLSEFTSSDKIVSVPVLSGLKGMKIGRFLNNLLDMEILTTDLFNKNGDCVLVSNTAPSYTSLLPQADEKIKEIRARAINGTLLSKVNELYVAPKDVLVLSINPEDFFTMSCGNSWTSCMTPGGEYDSGTLPYALGKDSMIAFTISEAKHKESLFVQKEWRQIVYLNEVDNLIFQKGYPCKRISVSERIAKDIVKRLGLDVSLTPREEFEICKNRISFEGDFGYPDIARGTFNAIDLFYGGLPSDLLEEGNRFGTITIKGQNSSACCLNCGNTTYDLSESGGLCFNCTDEDGCCTCDYCSEPTYEDDTSYIEEYGLVCSDCIASSFVFSDDYSEYILAEDAIEVLVPVRSRKGITLVSDFILESEEQVIDGSDIKDFDLYPISSYYSGEKVVPLMDLSLVEGEYYIEEPENAGA